MSTEPEAVLRNVLLGRHQSGYNVFVAELIWDKRLKIVPFLGAMVELVLYHSDGIFLSGFE